MEPYNFTQESLREHLLKLYAISTQAGGLDAGVRLNEARELVSDYLYNQMQSIGLHNVPKPWVDGPPEDLLDGPPEDLLFDIIPPNPRIFSTILMWRGHFVSEGIGRISDITWNFGNLTEKISSRTCKGPATGTIYMTPGIKTIRMTITDRYGRQSFIERKIKVSW